MAQWEDIDVLIVGAGPAGTSTALHLLQKDPEWAGRIAIVEKAVHPREKLCGGGITHMGQNILTRLGLQIEPPGFDVREARLVYRNLSFSFLGNPVFRVVRRDELDHWLLKQVEKRGVRVYQGEAARSITLGDEFVEIVTEKRAFRAGVLVGADGSKSFVRRALKWPGESRVARLLEILTPEDERTAAGFREAVAVFDFNYLVDGLQGYYWDFPSYIKGNPYMNRGVFDSRAWPERPKANLKSALRELLNERGRDLDDYELKGHPIRWWDRNSQFSMPRVLLVGDAAGADVLVGEGIAFALGYGQVAASAIADAFERQDFSLSAYRKRLLADPLFRQLDLRARLGRLAYKLNYAPLIGLAWWLAPWVLRFTPWRDRNFVPIDPPRLVLDREARA